MSIRIRIEHGQDAGKTWRLSEPGVYVLGRHTASSIRVLDMKVSKAHAEVHLVEKNGHTNAVLRDLGSTHGSQVNGQPVNGDKALRPGDELRLGLTIMRVLSDGNADEDVAPIKDRALDESSVSTATSSSSSIDTSSAKKLPPDELVGKRLGGYRVEQKIGKGGMGAVYLAEQVSLHRQVALKVLSEKFVTDEAFVDQFLNEARAAGALNHPNVVQVYDVGEAEGHYYFSMEFVSGGSIEEKMRAKEAYTWQDGLNWFLDATNALVFAKKRDILHRDVKPDNLMISEDGSAKLCDLGLAKRSENKDLLDQGIIGTPHFIAPEAIRRKTSVDHRADLYSLGCTFYRILAGRNPYPGKSVKDILLGHLKRPVPHLADHNPNVPKELDEIVFKLMQKEPDERFQTPDELLVALDKVRVRHGLEAHGLAPKSGKRWIVIAAVAVAVAIGGVIFAMNQETETVTVEDPAAIRAREEAARDKLLAKYSGYENDAREELGEIRRKVTDLKIADTLNFWTNPEYAQQADKYDAYATTWEGKLGEFKTERAKYKHEAIVGKIDEVTTSVTEYVGTAKKGAEDIRGTITKRKAMQVQVRETRTQSLKDITAALDKKKTELQALYDDGKTDFAKWVTLAAALTDDEDAAAKSIVDLVQPLFDAAVVQAEPVLDWDKDVKPLIEKRFTKKGFERWQTDPPKLVMSMNAQSIAQGKKLAKAEGAPTPDTLQQGIDFLTKWLEKLPEKPEPADLKVSKAIADARKTAKGVVDELTDQKNEKIALGLLADRLRYHRMILEIRAPLGYGNGSWFQFQHSQSEIKITSFAGLFKTPRYAELGRMWLRDTQAIKGLFVRLKQSWDADKWGGERNVVYVDENGEEQKCRCQSVEVDRMEDRKKVLLFEVLGPRVVLDSVLHHQDKDERVPRFTFEGEDFRGLALMAELAADFEAAKKWWNAYKATVSADSPQAADAAYHLAALPGEEQAGKTWAFAQQLRRNAAATMNQFDPKFGPVTDDDWRRFMDERRKLNEQISGIQERLDQLATDAKLATTIWGASIREFPHRKAAYAGDVVEDKIYDKLIRQAWKLAFPDEPAPDFLPKPK